MTIDTIISKTASKFYDAIFSSKSNSGHHFEYNTKVFVLILPKHLRWTAYCLVLFVVLIALTMQLTNLTAKNDNQTAMWTPPVEPQGAVIVTSNDSLPRLQPASTAPPAQAAAVKESLVSRPVLTASPSPIKDAATEELILALAQWSDAWRRQDMEAYLGAYAPSFIPAKGASREAWAKQRTARIKSKKTIRHEIRDMGVQFSEKKAIVKFTQIYSDERLQQTEQKTMQWVQIDGRWLITRESAP